MGHSERHPPGPKAPENPLLSLEGVQTPEPGLSQDSDEEGLEPDWDNPSPDEQEAVLELFRELAHRLRPQAMPPRLEKLGRNDPCPCGSGKKYKRCHGS
jgi:preprotein translocase subunit SecA